MREPQRDNGRLEDILTSSLLIKEQITQLSYEEFIGDRIRYFGFVKSVEIIGEAAYMLTPVFKSEHPEIPWKDIVKMRHVLVHGYSSILPEILWKTCKEEIPLLIPLVRDLL